MKKITSLVMLCMILLPGLSLAEDFYESQLNNGIRNSDVYSYLLLQEAQGNRAQSIDLLNKAYKHSPDLPAVYFELAKAKFSFSASGILASVDFVVAGIDAYSRNFWWAFSLAGGTFFSLVVSFILTMLVIAVIRLISDLPLISHEVGESKQDIIPLLALFFISLISPLLFLAGIMILLGLYMSRMDKAVVYLFLVFLLLSPLLFRTASLFLNVSSSGTMKAIVTVNESRGNAYALSSLKDSDNPAALFSYALALKRTGLYEDALAAYNRLVTIRPDAQVYVNLGNTYVGKNNVEEAIKKYLAAVSIRPLASAYYNLSRVSRELFEFEKGDEYYKKAIEIDRYAVSGYQAIYDRNPNRLVVDETLTFPSLWKIAKENRGEPSAFGLVSLPVWVNSLAALLLIFAFYYLNSRSRDKAYRCKRCNSIFCPRCEKHIMWGQMCPQCYRSLIKLDETEVKERVSRLLSIYEHQNSRRRIMKVLAFVLPGSSQIFAGKILYGFLFLWPFLFCLTFPVATMALTSGSMISHWALSSAALFLAFVLYIFSNMFTRQRITKGWL